MKLEEESRRVCAVEKMRLDDLGEMERLGRILEINGIKTL
jgi:hypothetical protein